MIAKITRGADLPRLVRYLFGPGRANEHTDQRAVALAGSLDATPVGVVLDRGQVAHLGEQMDAVRIRYRVSAKGAAHKVTVGAGARREPGRLPGTVEEHRLGPGHVWHMSLTTPVGDRQLSDAEWARIATAAMDRMGFTETSGKTPVRWVAVRHGMSVQGNDHVHIAATIVRDDGSKATVFRDYKKMSALAAEVEREYGLVVVGGRTTSGGPGLTRAEIERARRDGRPEALRTTLARLVREVRTSSANEAEFVRRLRSAGALVRPRWAGSGAGEDAETVVGYSVGFGGKGETVWFGGGRLGADLSLPQLRQFWEATPSETAAAVIAWKTPGGRRRETHAISPDEWRRATGVLDSTYAALQELPTDSPEWPVVARELSGLYAAWSRRIEGSRPGPLARAADLLAQAGQVAPNETVAPRSAVRGYRGAAMVVSQGHLGPKDRGTGWGMLLVALHRHLQLVSEIEAARGQLRVSEQLSESAEALERAGKPAAPQESRGQRVPIHEHPKTPEPGRAAWEVEKGAGLGR